MARRGFAAIGGGIELRLGDYELEILENLLQQIAHLVSPAQGEADDPLAAMVGIGASDTPPADPALARLLPDAYRDDPDAAADFRRYTEQDLRRQKVDNSRCAIASLQRARRGRVRLTPAEADAWLRSLNDLRLVLAVRLGIDSPDDEAPQDELYDWLTWLQASLVDALMGA